MRLNGIREMSVRRECDSIAIASSAGNRTAQSRGERSGFEELEFRVVSRKFLPWFMERKLLPFL